MLHLQHNTARGGRLCAIRRWGSGSTSHRATETSNYATGLGIKTKGTDDPTTAYVSNPSVYATRGTTWFGDDGTLSIYVLVPRPSWTAGTGGARTWFLFYKGLQRAPAVRSPGVPTCGVPLVGSEQTNVTFGLQRGRAAVCTADNRVEGNTIVADGSWHAIAYTPES